LLLLLLCAASELTIFAPCNEAMKHVPQIFGLDNLSEFFMNEAALKEVSTMRRSLLYSAGPVDLNFCLL
jgi:hypothetical protein